MAELFDINTMNESSAGASGFVAKQEKPDKSRFFRGAGIDCLQGLLPTALENGATYHFVSRGDWSLYELIDHLLYGTGRAEMWMTTWSLSELSARKIVEWIDNGRLSAVHALVDYRAQNRHPEAYHLARHNIADLRVGNCHAKVTVLKCSTGYVTIVGSANWTENPRIECGVISTLDEVALAHIGWISEVIEKGSYEFGNT